MTDSTPENTGVQELVQKYNKDQGWEELLSAAEQTSRVVRLLAESLVEVGVANTESMTVLHRLCQHKEQHSPESKISDVQQLEIPEPAENELVSQITDSVGSVGGTNLHLQIPEEHEEDTLELLRILTTKSDRETLDSAIQHFGDFDVTGVQSGLLSPIIHYLHPTMYPIVNGLSRDGMESYFGRSLSYKLADYLSVVEEFEAVRDEYDFNKHYRHLDFFFIWAGSQTQPEGSDYFILRTGSDEWKDTPAEEYHFRDGIPGSRQLREATGARIIYLEDGDFYATATIDGVTSETQGDETHFVAQITEYEEIDSISASMVESELNQSLSVQNGIISISKNDYQTIIEEADKRYFWVNRKEQSWPGNQENVFYTSKTSSGNPRRIKEAFERARPGDRVIVYRIVPSQRIEGTGRIVEGLHEEPRGEYDEPVPGITIGGENTFEGPTWSELLADPRLEEATPISSNNRMLFAELSREEYARILEMIEVDDNKPNPEVVALRDRLSPPSLSIPLPDQLYFDDKNELRRQIEATLNSGKHIIFTGPPGTGKTKLAKEIAEYCAVEYPEHVDDYRFTTATSAWTTFDTIGGYVPRQQAGGDELVFQPRIFLNCFRDEAPRNDWLVIDEINRSDIDKAFGQLFSVLSGDTVELPYERESPVEIVSLDSGFSDTRLKSLVDNEDRFPVTPSWRLLATMNTYDKASLYELSYAFMRRFNFIHVGIPDLRNSNGEVRTSLLNPQTETANYATKWIEADPHLEAPLQRTYRELAVVWARINTARSIGPSIIRDILGYIAASDTAEDTHALLTDAIIALVYPQLEGMRPQEQKKLIESLSERGVETETGVTRVQLDQERLRLKAEDFFNISFEEDD